MARKQHPYNAMTTKRFREMGRYYEKAEYLNPFHIIKERDDLRIFRRDVQNICVKSAGLTDINILYGYINLIASKAASQQENKYFFGEKKDMFGFIDYICIDPIIGVIAVQVTSASGHAEHRRKILRNDYAARWVCFDRIELWSWRKSPKNRGGRLLIWKERIEVFTLEDFKSFSQKNTSPACLSK